jgi:hypothetical protein
MAKLLRILLPCLLGLAAALLVACGDTTGFIPSTDASQINQNIDAASNAVSSGRCTRAQSAVDRALTHVDQLPASVDPQLKARLVEGLRRLQAESATECAANKPEKTTSTETTTTDTTPTETTDTTPTDTATIDTQTQPTETQTQPTDTQPQTDTTQNGNQGGGQNGGNGNGNGNGNGGGSQGGGTQAP